MPRYASLMRKFTREEIMHFLKESHVVLKRAGLVVRVAQAKKEWGRIAIIIPKRFGSSPQRHLFKRQARAIFYENKFFQQPYDVALFAYRPIPFADLQAVFADVYTKIPQLFIDSSA